MPETADRLRELDALPDGEVDALLRSCCASSAWVDRVRAGRPYGTPERLLAAADRASRALTAADVEQALAVHPRIGERADGASTEARWSRQEQASVSDADARTRERLRELNVEYERRFDRVFLVRAAGRTPEQILGELERRLGNDPEAERHEVAEQLAQITRLRVERLLTA